MVNSDDMPSGENVLDYGCGNRPYETLLKSKFSNYIGADFSGNELADLTFGEDGTLPVADDTVDCVISTQVLEHVESPRFYLSEAFRVLKPNGVLLLSTHGIWIHHPDPTDYWRWTIDGLQMEIRKAKFELLAFQSVFRIASCALLLWQDATIGRIPRPLQPAYVYILQSMMGLVERKPSFEASPNASVYVLLARKNVQHDQRVEE